MRQIIKLAWKNLWRKKKRSFAAIASIMVAVILIISIRSLQLSTYDRMIDAAVKTTGYLQVHLKGYWKNKSINDLMPQSHAFEQKLGKIPSIRNIVPRLENFVLAAGGSRSKDALLIGIDPGKENTLRKLSSRLIAGNYLLNSDQDVLITEGLAKYLNLRLHDTLVLISQGYQANVAAGKYRISGIVKLINPKLNLLHIYMPLATAQAFNSAPEMISAYLIDADKGKDGDQLMASVKHTVGEEFETMLWSEISPDILNNLQIDTVLFIMISLALFIITGFGIVGAILMMSLERSNEFSVLNAVGLQKSGIRALILTESIILGLTGLLLAFLIVLPIVYWLHLHPVPLKGDAAKPFQALGAEPFIGMAVAPELFLFVGSVIFIVNLIATAYPLFRIHQLNISNHLK
jgi:ABC-type lipoprotein release transport system permease subunit